MKKAWCAPRKPTGLLVAAWALCVSLAHAGPCMVMGDKAARVFSEEGERSPAFLTQSCEKLKLISGRAMVSWVGQDGRPQLAPIGEEGVKRYPSPGAEERSAKVVWAEVTNVRGSARPALVRSIGNSPPAKLYVPPEGVYLYPGKHINGRLRLASKPTGPWADIPIPAVGPLVLDRHLLPAGQEVVLEWSGGEQPIQWHWRMIPDTEQRSLDEKYTLLDGTGLDAEQQGWLRAMWFEQMRLPLNMNLTLKGLP